MSGEERTDGTGTAASDPGAAPEVSFNEAVTELEQILGRIEGDDVDLDRLAAELERAVALLEVCRRKIRRAELEVSHIVDKLGDEDAR